MNQEQTLSNPTWTLTLPGSWLEVPDPDAGLHYESEDESQGMYIATWTMAAGSTRAPRELAQEFLDADKRELAGMAGNAWRTLGEQLDCEGDVCVALLDSYDEEHQYRIVSKILARADKVVRATFHDFACADLAASDALFAPLLASLIFTARS